MNLRQLEVFHAVMKAGSVTGAARTLNVSQPAVSAVLKHAELSLRIELFQRIGGRLEPTAEALALLPDVEEIFGRIETLNRAVHEMRAGRAGDLVVASSPTLVNTLLPTAIARLRKANAGIHVFFHSLPTNLVVERVARREADIGLVYGPANDPAVTVEHLASSEIVCAMPRRHALARRRQLDAEDLQKYSVISLGPTTRLGAAIDAGCRAAGVQPPVIRTEASSSFTACLMVAEGAGIALIDGYAVLSRRFDDLVFKAFVPRVGVDLLLIFPLNRRRSRAAMELAEILRGIVAQQR